MGICRYGYLDKTRTYPGAELVMSMTQIAKILWYQCGRCGVTPIHKCYSVVTVDNIVSDVCKKCLGEFGLLQSRYREYVLINGSSEKLKIYQKRGLLDYETLLCDMATIYVKL